MKKTAIAVVMVFAAMALVACQPPKQETKPVQKQATSKTAPAPAPTPAPAPAKH